MADEVNFGWKVGWVRCVSDDTFNFIFKSADFRGGVLIRVIVDGAGSVRRLPEVVSLDGTIWEDGKGKVQEIKLFKAVLCFVGKLKVLIKIVEEFQHGMAYGWVGQDFYVINIASVVSDMDRECGVEGLVDGLHHDFSQSGGDAAPHGDATCLLEKSVVEAGICCVKDEFKEFKEDFFC